jgi:HAD superfamily hydrolase (TIGR01509 family)
LSISPRRADIAPQLVIFDCDGVLVDSETLTNKVFARLIRAEGWDISFEECCDQLKGLSMVDCVAKIEARLGKKLHENWPEQYRKETYKTLDAQVQIMPGAREAVTLVRQAGKKHCIASSGPMEKMRITLGRTGLMDDFDGVVFNTDMVSRGKPHPDLFLYAASQMNVDPAACIVIEDSRYGAQAARAAGMACLGYIGGILKDEAGLAAEQAILIDDLQDIAQYL